MTITQTADWAGELSALESRAEIDSLEDLQQRRRELVKTYAPLAAKFKGGTTAGSDSARKRHRALVAKRILANLKPDEKAPAENALERMANADLEHIEFCEKLERDFARFIMLENDIADITEKIRNREECLRVYRAELTLER